MKKYQFEGYDIIAPFSIASNEPMFDSDSISLKKQRSSQGVQRWELSFGIVTSNPSSLMAAIVDFDTVKTMTMPQLNEVNNRIGTTTNSSPTTTNYTVTASGGKFYIDGVQNPTLTLVKGNTYIFDLSDNSMGSHPFRFATEADGANSSQYTTGITYSGTQGFSGATCTFVVPNNAPSTLYYYCGVHSGMGNSITINAAGTVSINYPKGAFVTGSNNKVYMIKADATSVVDSNLYPTPPSGLTYSTVDNATIRYYRSIDNLKGITFSDGLIANPGTVNIIEAL